MRNSIKSLFQRLFCLALLCSVMATGICESGQSYIYSEFSAPIPAPNAYELEKSYYAKDIEGVSGLEDMQEAVVFENSIYLLLKNRLLILDKDFKLNKTIDKLDFNGSEILLEDMSGLAINKDGFIFMTSLKSGEILELDRNYSVRRVIPKPIIDGFENVAYKPIKLAVDAAGRIYIVAKGMYEGIVELNPDGSFSRFFGVNKVKFSAWQYIWRIFATKEQLKRQSLWLPTDFTNIKLDKQGFMYACIKADAKTEPIIKRLNSSGNNIMQTKNTFYPVGDIAPNNFGSGIPTGSSVFISVDTNSDGVFICLDQKRGRVFAYNEDGRLLYIFGGLGQTDGHFRNPIDVDFLGDKIIVLDSLAKSIELYRPTEYGKAIISAVHNQFNFNYAEAKEQWQRVLEINPSFWLAHSGIGRALLREEKYEQALESLRLGSDRPYYSKAFEKVRNERLKSAFFPIVVGIFALVLLKTSISIIRKRRHSNEI